MLTINIKPFYERDGVKYDYKCLSVKTYWFCAEYRLSVDVLRRNFSDELEFDYDDGMFTVHLDDINDLHILQSIDEDTNQYPLREEINNNGTHLKFEIISYSFDD